MIRLKIFRKKRWLTGCVGLMLVLLLSSCTLVTKKDSAALAWAKNLKEEDVLQVEMVVTPEENGKAYHLFSKEEIPQIVALIRESPGKEALPIEKAFVDYVDLFVTTTDRMIHQVRLHEYFIVDDEWYELSDLKVVEGLREKADRKIPVDFHFGEKRKAFKGLELYIWKGEGGATMYTILPATDALKKEEQIYLATSSTTEVDFVRAALAQQEDGLTFFVWLMDPKDFSKEEAEEIVEQFRPFMPPDSSVAMGYFSEMHGGDASVDAIDKMKHTPLIEVLNGIDRSQKRELDPKEIEKINQSLETLSPSADPERELEINPICHFFTSYYDQPQDLNLNEFLWYFPGEVLMPNSEADVRQFEALKKLPNFPYKDAKDLSETITPVHRIKVEDVDAVLKEYAGIVSQDVKNRADILYLEEYRSFYVYTSDFGPGYFNCGRGVVDGDRIKLFSDKEAGSETILTLKYEKGKYLIESFAQI